MKITYMGTAAAEGIPALFCRCPICENARKRGGKDQRTRSQALINDDLLIDFPADTYLHTLRYHFDLPGIRHLLITHCHPDHFYPADLTMLSADTAHPLPPAMHIYGSPTVHQAFQSELERAPWARDNFIFTEPVPFRTMTVGKYQVTALLALHDRSQQCLFYEIGQGGKWLLYAHDTGNFPPATWEYLQRAGHCYGLVSLDCTMMRIKDGGNHMGLADDKEVRQHLLDIHAANEDTVFVANHFSHNGGWDHEELTRQAHLIQFIGAYDGMEITF